MIKSRRLQLGEIYTYFWYNLNTYYNFHVLFHSEMYFSYITQGFTLKFQIYRFYAVNMRLN